MGDADEDEDNVISNEEEGDNEDEHDGFENEEDSGDEGEATDTDIDMMTPPTCRHQTVDPDTAGFGDTDEDIFPHQVRLRRKRSIFSWMIHAFYWNLIMMVNKMRQSMRQLVFQKWTQKASIRILEWVIESPHF